MDRNESRIPTDKLVKGESRKFTKIQLVTKRLQKNNYDK
jgi:hypothetical protein